MAKPIIAPLTITATFVTIVGKRKRQGGCNLERRQRSIPYRERESRNSPYE
jgi:hypothetical protein